MEIFGLVRVTRGRVLVTVVIMALAVAAAGAVVLSRPAQIRSSNQVLLDQQFGASPGTEADIAAENLNRSFPAALNRADRAAQLTGVQVVRGQGSTLVDVLVTGTGQAPAVRDAARRLTALAIADLLEQSLQASATTLNAAQQRLADSQGELDAFSASSGVADVPTALTTQGQLVATLQASLAAGGSTGALAAAQKQLDRLVKLRPEFVSLQSRRDAAQAELVGNLSAVGLIQSRIALQRSGVALLQGGTGKVSQRLPAVRSALGAAAVALVLLLTLFALLDARRRRSPHRQPLPRASTDREVAPVEPADAPAPTPAGTVPVAPVSAPDGDRGQPPTSVTGSTTSAPTSEVVPPRDASAWSPTPFRGVRDAGDVV